MRSYAGKHNAKLDILAPADGMLAGWAIAGSEVVREGALLGEVLTPDDGAIEFRAPWAGRVVRNVARATQVTEGQVIAVLHYTSDTPRHVPHVEELVIDDPPPTTRENVVDAPEVREAHPASNSTPTTPHARPGAPQATSRDTPRPRPRTSHATYHLTDQQVADLKALAALHKEIGEGTSMANVSESELLRAALDLFLALPAPVRAPIIERNRQKERDLGYGVGWPRPRRSTKRRRKKK